MPFFGPRAVMGGVGLAGRIAGYLTPFVGLGKVAVDFGRAAPSALKTQMARKALRQAGSGSTKTLFGSRFQQVFDIVKSGLDASDLNDFTSIPKANLWKRVSGQASKMAVLRRDVNAMIGTTVRSKMKHNEVQSMVSMVLGKHGVPRVDPTRLSGALMDSQARAYEALNRANLSRDLLNGPTLMANAAALAIPTLMAGTTTSMVVRGLKHRASTAYNGYEGNVF